jgi:hypothetical protein
VMAGAESSVGIVLPSFYCHGVVTSHLYSP